MSTASVPHNAPNGQNRANQSAPLTSLLHTPIIKSTAKGDLLPLYLMYTVSRILEGTVLFINYEEDGRPFLTDRDGNIPSRESFNHFVECINEWYSSADDNLIDLYNKVIAFENLVCPDPKMINDDELRPGYIYIIRADTGHYKIGRTKNVGTRMNFFRVQLPFKFDLVLTFPVADMYRAESLLHDLCSPLRVNGEWFELSNEHVNYLIDRLGKYDYFSQQSNDPSED